MMDKEPENMFLSVCSVAQMAAKLGLSPARFYQLQNQGVFPPPIYLLSNKRPFYSNQLEQQCITIRKTGIGLNGQLVLFHRHKKASRRYRTVQPQLKQFCQNLSVALREMHLRVSEKAVAAAIPTIFPEGMKNYTVDGDILKKVFRYFKSEKYNGV